MTKKKISKQNQVRKAIAFHNRARAAVCHIQNWLVNFDKKRHIELGADVGDYVILENVPELQLALNRCKKAGITMSRIHATNPKQRWLNTRAMKILADERRRLDRHVVDERTLADCMPQESTAAHMQQLWLLKSASAEQADYVVTSQPTGRFDDLLADGSEFKAVEKDLPEPALTDADIDRLIDECAVTDAAGVLGQGYSIKLYKGQKPAVGEAPDPCDLIMASAFNITGRQGVFAKYEKDVLQAFQEVSPACYINLKIEDYSLLFDAAVKVVGKVSVMPEDLEKIELYREIATRYRLEYFQWTTKQAQTPKG